MNTKRKKGSPVTQEEKLEIMRRKKNKETEVSISKATGISVRAVQKVIADHRALLKEPEELTTEDLFGGDLDEFSAQESIRLSLKASIRLLQQAVKDMENNYIIVDERMRKIPLKTLMDCIEKAVKAFTQMDSKKNNTNVGDFKINYVEMAKLYMDAKRDKKYYDSAQHMKDLLNLAHGKIK